MEARGRRGRARRPARAAAVPGNGRHPPGHCAVGAGHHHPEPGAPGHHAPFRRLALGCHLGGQRLPAGDPGAAVPCAHLGERIGYKRVYLAGLAVFTLASLACVFAPSLLLLALARGGAGPGGGGHDGRERGAGAPDLSRGPPGPRHRAQLDGGRDGLGRRAQHRGAGAVRRIVALAVPDPAAPGRAGAGAGPPRAARQRLAGRAAPAGAGRRVERRDVLAGVPGRRCLRRAPRRRARPAHDR